MSAPAWFDKDVYFANKLAQLQETQPAAEWTDLKMMEAFTTAGFNPFTADGLYDHFVAFGNKEDVSPNAYFDVDTYMANKLAQLQADEPASSWTMEKLEAAFADEGLSAWDHYTQFGVKEGINPSKFFNTNDYMNAKLAQMQATDPSYTMDMLYAAFQKDGLNPIEHYVLFGQKENLTYTPYPVDNSDPDKTVVYLLGNGSTFAIGDPAGNPADPADLPSEYTLVGTAEQLNAANYTIVSGAKGDVVLEGDVATILELGTEVKNALALASKVNLQGSLNALVQADLPSALASKTVYYEVTDVDDVNMQNVTVAQALNAQNILDKFLENSYVDFGDESVPENIQAKVVSVRDTVAHLTSEDAKQIDRDAILNVQDSAASIDAASAGFLNTITDKKGDIIVKDTLGNYLNMDAADVVTGIVATNTSSVSMKLDADDVTQFGKMASRAGITFDSLKDEATIKVDLTEAIVSGAGIKFDANVFTVENTTVTFDITGSAEADTITASDLGGTIDGGLGADQIILGAGKDTVVIGAGDVSNYKVQTGAGSQDVIGTSVAFAQNDDFIAFGGFLDGFKGVSAKVTGAADSKGFGAAVTDDHMAIVLTGDWGTGATGSGAVISVLETTGNSYGGEALVIGASGNDTYVWYAHDANGNGSLGANEVQIIAIVSGDAALTAENFVDLN